MDAPANRLNLAHEAPFHLGELRVEPALRLVSNGETSEIIEPRVMKLLVALHAAGGQILSRDDLVEQCWDGRIVGENAIQRAISQARKIADGIGERSFDIETIRGVGYRLRTNSCTNAAGQKGSRDGRATLRISRRIAVAAAGASAVAAAGGFVLFGSLADAPSEMARKLYAQGEAARREQDGDVTGEQAVAFYSKAVEDSPGFAAAWSGLALAHCDLLEVTSTDQLERVATLATSAAARSLELDAANVNARLAQLLVRPPFRRWKPAQAELESLSKDDRRNWLIQSTLGKLAADIGDFDAAIGHYRQALDLEPLLPRVFGCLAYASWAAGRLHDAAQLLEEGVERWPRSWWLWNIRFQFLAFEGQTAAAARHVANDSRTPWNLAADGIPKRLQLIRALESRNADDMARSRQAYLDEGRHEDWPVRNATLALGALGAYDELFELLRGFYLGAGRYPKRINRYSRRPTYFLFLPPMRPVHSDPRFAALLAAIGLDRF